MTWRVGEREVGREGGRVGERDGGEDGGREQEREGGREEGRKGGREGGGREILGLHRIWTIVFVGIIILLY